MLQRRTLRNMFILLALDLFLVILLEIIIKRVFVLDLGQLVFKLFFAYPGVSLIMGILGVILSKKLWTAPLVNFITFNLFFFFITTKMQFRIELLIYSLGFALIAYVGSLLTWGVRKLIESRKMS